MRFSVIAGMLICLSMTACFGGNQSSSEGGGQKNQPPVADFAVRGRGLDIKFTTQSKDSDGKISKWAWDFGNGERLEVPNPEMAYLSPGKYVVQLTVTDNKGAAHTTSKSIQVNVNTDPKIDK